MTPDTYRLPEPWPPQEIAILESCGEFFAAGFLGQAGSPLRRMARGLRCQLENAHLPIWNGEALFPSGAYSWFRQGSSVAFDYSYSLVIVREAAARQAGSANAAVQTVYQRLLHDLGNYPNPTAILDPDLTLGGNNYTHSILNYGRVLREGLAGYEARTQRGLQRAVEGGDQQSEAFYRSMADVLAGIRAAHRRSLERLLQNEPAEPGRHIIWQRLVEAFHQVPWQPARSFYEALVSTNFLYYLDGCDSLGRFDQDLGSLFDADLDAGLAIEQGIAWVAQLWDNVDANGGWNVAIGGCDAEGRSASNRLTAACLRAARRHRRPNLALRITDDMPEAVLDEALNTIATGCGIPALYNDGQYRYAVQHAGLAVRPADYAALAFGGCTELMVHGCSNVGSLDAGINLPLVLSKTLSQSLASADSFEVLLEAFKSDLTDTAARTAQQVSEAQELHARWQPQPLRTLLVDDCLDAALEFNAGGARYNWSVINIGGLGNVVDSLAALRELVFELGYIGAAAYAQALADNFSSQAALVQRIQRCPRYGNDDVRADSLAREVSEHLFKTLHRHIPWRGGRFLPGCLMFVTYAQAGESVTATPDGRLAGQPIADSIGPVAGRDRSGPTALIRSVAGIPQYLAPGTLVTNFRFARSFFEGEDRARLKELIRTYFHLGGMQMQISVVDQLTLRAALAQPEQYADLIVRVGGYSEYWINLSPSLRETVLERTEYASSTLAP